ncbi:MAG: hypothetical protein Q9217_004575 [Psora testacea]
MTSASEHGYHPPMQPSPGIRNRTPTKLKVPRNFKDEDASLERAGNVDKDPSIERGVIQNRHPAIVRFGLFRGLRSRIKKRLCDKPRDLAIHRHGIRLQFQPLPHEKNHIAPALPHSQPLGRHDATSHVPSSTVEVASGGQKQPPIGDLSPTIEKDVEEPLPGSTKPMSTEQNSGSPRARGATVGDHTKKMRRLSIIRREKTLRKQALCETKCRCTENCPCKAAASPSCPINHQHDGPNSMPDLSVGALSSYRLERLREPNDSSDSHSSIGSARHLYTDLFGVHITENCVISEANQSSLAGSSSQATTLQSDGSSISLKPQAPNYTNRASAPAILPFRRRHRRIQSAMRHAEVPDHAHDPIEDLGNADPSQAGSRCSSTDTGSRPSTTAGSESRAPLPAEPNSTILANLRDPGENHLASYEQRLAPDVRGPNGNTSLHESQQTTPTQANIQPERDVPTLLPSVPQLFSPDS